MNEIEWYYAHDEQQFGPVSTAELKRLADRGELVPGDLVWRQGVADWVEASQVKGLFQPQSQATAAKPAPAALPQVTPVVEPRADKPSVRGATVGRQAAPAWRHPVEVVLSAARASASPAFVESSTRMFVAAGHYALYAVMLLVLIGGAAISYHGESVVPVLFALAAIPVLAVLQYAAGQFCAALERVNRSTRAMVASTTLIDLIGITSMVLGLLLLLALATMAITSQTYALLLTALLVFILCQQLAAVSLVHVDENVIVADELSPGEEALGTLVTLLKASARVVPVAFGAGICCGTVTLLAACVYCVQGGESGLMMGWVVGLEAAMTTTVFAVLPMVGYLAFLLSALVFDILDGLLTLRQSRQP